MIKCIYTKRLIYFYIYLFMCMNVLCAYIHIHCVHAWCQPRSKEGAESPATRARDGYEPPCVKSGEYS